jgi:hypothetical protein
MDLEALETSFDLVAGAMLAGAADAELPLAA